MPAVILVHVSDDYRPEDGRAFEAVVAALEHAEIPAFVEERDESETLIHQSRDIEASAIDRRMRRILAGEETLPFLVAQRPSRKAAP